MKTLDLPLGGAKSPIDALALLISLVQLTNAERAQVRKPISEFPDDVDGSKTIQTLDECQAIVQRVAGLHPGSLGLHPAVYYYSERGRHIPDLLLGTLLWMRRKIQDNNNQFFKDFSSNRQGIEATLVSKKGLITQALQIARSQTRIERVADLLDFLVEKSKSKKAVSDEDVVRVIAPNSFAKILAVGEGTAGRQFSDDAKSAIFIRTALGSAVKCKICGGYLDVAKSVSYDHVLRVREGGTGDAENGQLTHPFCNTGLKA